MEVIRGEKQFRMKIYHNVAVKEKHSSSLNILLYSSTSDTKLVGLGGGFAMSSNSGITVGYLTI